MEVTLEKVDQVRERTGASYAEAKYALEANNGDVLEAIIYIENTKSTCKDNNDAKEKYETIDELKKWLKDIINKGNVTRIKVSKDGKVLVDVPVNAGIAAGVIAIIIPQILAFLVIAAVVTKITIEITKADGSVEIVNKYISKAVEDIKDAAMDVKEKVKDKVNEVKNENLKNEDDKNQNIDEKIFTYTVNFDDEENKDK